MSSVISLVRQNLEPLLGPTWYALRDRVNGACDHLEPWQIVLYSVTFTVTGVWVYEFVFKPGPGMVDRAKKYVFRTARRLPFVKDKIASEVMKQRRSMIEHFHKTAKGQSYINNLPTEGLTEEDILNLLLDYKKLVEVDWSKGACSGTVYSGDDKIGNFMSKFGSVNVLTLLCPVFILAVYLDNKIYSEFVWTNPLHADVFPDVRKMEAEVVRMTCNIFNGNSESCGTMTSGGTESIMLACKAYRDMAYDRGVEHPEMIVPVTAHAAFDKAASYFCITIIHIPIDEVTRKVDVAAMKRAITSRTCMLAGSAPQFPHGVIDPIEDIAKLGLKYGIPVHVDSCLGGFLLPFMREAGYSLPPFDFSVKGVTSISADTHKFGYAPKGSSVIMYSDELYRQFQYFVQPDWPGGIYASPTFAGSRPGAIIAACWATMMLIGRKGYVDSTRKIIETTRHIEAEIRKIPGLFVYGKPDASVVGFGSHDFNVYRLSDALSACGWNLNALQFPSSIHLCVTLVHTKPGVAEKFVADVANCTREIMEDPKADCGGQAALYGLAQSIPDRSIVSEIAAGFFDGYYSTS